MSGIILTTPAQAYEVAMLALVCYREAQGEPLIAQIGQSWSVRNRVMKPSWWGKDWVSVILRHASEFYEVDGKQVSREIYQYSCFNPGDPNAGKFLVPADPVYAQILDVAWKVWTGTVADPVDSATHYFDKSMDAKPPKWAVDGSMVKTADLGRFHFYRLK